MSSRSLTNEREAERLLDHLVARCVLGGLECHFLHDIGTSILVHWKIIQTRQTKPSSFALPEPTKTPIELTYPQQDDKFATGAYVSRVATVNPEGSFVTIVSGFFRSLAGFSLGVLRLYNGKETSPRPFV